MDNPIQLVAEQKASMNRIAAIFYELAGLADTEEQQDAMVKWMVNLTLTQRSAAKAIRLLDLKG